MAQCGTVSFRKKQLSLQEKDLRKKIYGYEALNNTERARLWKVGTLACEWWPSENFIGFWAYQISSSVYVISDQIRFMQYLKMVHI